MTHVRAWTILLVCTALISGPMLGPASAFGATGKLSLAKPPWLVSTALPSGSGSSDRWVRIAAADRRGRAGHPGHGDPAARRRRALCASAGCGPAGNLAPRMARREQSMTPADTEALGAELARTLRPGDVVLVEGELGAGKTTFVRGACRALGVTAVVTQPDVHDRTALPGPDPGVPRRPLPGRRPPQTRIPTCLTTTCGRTRSRSSSGPRAPRRNWPVSARIAAPRAPRARRRGSPRRWRSRDESSVSTRPRVRPPSRCGRRTASRCRRVTIRRRASARGTRRD